MITNYFNYYTEIEEYFIRKRKKNLLISPLDWCLIELWKENEIPLHIVFRGIDRSFEAAERKGRSRPTTLHYCHPAIMEVFSEYKEASIGKSESETEVADSGPSREHILCRLADIRKSLEISQDLPGEQKEQAMRRLSDLGEEFNQSGGMRPEDIDRELISIGADLAEVLFAELDQDHQHRFELELSEQLRIYKKRLSKDMFRRLSQKHRVKKLLDLHQLPEFSLLGM